MEVFQTPEVARVFVSSFWNEAYRFKDRRETVSFCSCVFCCSSEEMEKNGCKPLWFYIYLIKWVGGDKSIGKYIPVPLGVWVCVVFECFFWGVKWVGRGKTCSE